MLEIPGSVILFTILIHGGRSSINAIYRQFILSLQAFFVCVQADFSKMQNVSEVVFAAMGQAFFTLSLGIGAIAIFGSYIDKSKKLTSEAITVVCLDTFVALVAGFIVIPACEYEVWQSLGSLILLVLELCGIDNNYCGI